MKSALLAAAWNSDSWTFEALEAQMCIRDRGKGKAGPGVVVPKAVGGQPAVDVAGFPGLQHLGAEDVRLGLRTLFQPVLHGGRGLPLQRKGDPALR